MIASPGNSTTQKAWCAYCWPPEIPTWGTMVAGSLQHADQAFWTILSPGLAIVLTALSLQMLGDGVRDLLDPKLKKAI